MSDQSGEQCSTPTLSWDYTEHRFQIFYLWLSWTIFFKLSYNVISYPLLKNYYRKSPMKYSSACYYVIIEDSVQCYFSSRNQCKPLSMWYLPICPDASYPPTPERENPTMLRKSHWKYLCQYQRGGRERGSKQRQVYC